MTIYEMKVNKDTAAMGAELIVGTRYLLQDINWRRGGVHLISPPVNLEYDRDTCGGERFIFEHGIYNAQPKIVIVSRLDEELKAKAVELSMKAVSLNDGKKVQLIVVGSGNAEGRLKELASEINCRHGRRLIHMVGAMSDPRPAYACADIVIGMGGSAARALAFGKPLIVAGEFGWFRIFEHSTADELFRNSFWSDETTADPAGDLNGHIQRLLSDQYDRRALGDFGRRFAQLNFGLEEMATKLVSVYETARRAYDVRAWCSDIPLELGFLSRRFTARRGYRNLALHEPSRGR
jgi:glycosyltransferase involved in cell wall biosynthesis